MQCIFSELKTFSHHCENDILDSSCSLIQLASSLLADIPRT